MDEDLYNHPLIRPLAGGEAAVPRKEIEDLARALQKNEILVHQCNRLFRIEASFNRSSEGLLAAWLAFSLALAKNEEAIHTFMDLFELVDPIEHDMLWELAQFALWQYGDQAVRELLNDFGRVLEIDHTGYFLGVLEVIGLSKDQLLRRRVSDQVIEALLSKNTSPAALMGLVDIVLILGDGRLPSVLADWKSRLPPKESKTLEEVEQILLDGDVKSALKDFRRPWHELAEFSVEHFAIHREIRSHPPATMEDFDALLSDFSMLADAFRRSPRFMEVPKGWRENPRKVVHLLSRIFGYLYEAYQVLPEDADAAEIAAMMEGVLPRKMTGDVSVFEPIPAILTAFYRFLTDGESPEEGEEFAAKIHEAKAAMLERAKDPDFWDPEKRDAMK